ncbi:hypothetical protein BD324DRAFT_326236 [Kockovaella imperatae]|uniref:Uncharacterized protein n=1 Tax=Kockovaella imperatae TaxID=4999 RepID=A0A1Y1UMR2_9TREE|nr:hypothetical protein BD324DRAFT_326236 [Kockovaella imperatae]ORX39341.1 hypothetical protein BD324DRAFT_326236 [Kockovaella imperatae]
MIVVILLPYLYSTLPNLPTIAKVARGDTSFGIWWGAYCMEREPWWRIVRAISLMIPALITFVLCVIMILSLWSCHGDPSPRVRVRRMECLQVAYWFLCALGLLVYSVFEQTNGWNFDWSPRVAENAIGPIVWLAFASNANIWRAYSHWLRLRRPPKPECLLIDDIETASFSKWLSPGSGRLATSVHSSRSSFYIPPPHPQPHLRAEQRRTWSPFSRKPSSRVARSRGIHDSETKRQQSLQADEKLQQNPFVGSSVPRSPPFAFSEEVSDQDELSPQALSPTINFTGEREPSGNLHELSRLPPPSQATLKDPIKKRVSSPSILSYNLPRPYLRGRRAGLVNRPPNIETGHPRSTSPAPLSSGLSSSFHLHIPKTAYTRPRSAGSTGFSAVSLYSTCSSTTPQVDTETPEEQLYKVPASPPGSELVVGKLYDRNAMRIWRQKRARI